MKIVLITLVCILVFYLKILSANNDTNIFGEPLEECCKDPITGYFRDGYCSTGLTDQGVHVVCATMTDQFLGHSRRIGNDLSQPAPHYNFPGLVPGDCWCLCASRWKEAMEQGVAPPLNLYATHRRMLDFVPLNILIQYNNRNDCASGNSYFVDR